MNDLITRLRAMSPEDRRAFVARFNALTPTEAIEMMKLKKPEAPTLDLDVLERLRREAIDFTQTPEEQHARAGRFSDALEAAASELLAAARERDTLRVELDKLTATVFEHVGATDPQSEALRRRPDQEPR